MGNEAASSGPDIASELSLAQSAKSTRLRRNAHVGTPCVCACAPRSRINPPKPLVPVANVAAQAAVARLAVRAPMASRFSIVGAEGEGGRNLARLVVVRLPPLVLQLAQWRARSPEGSSHWPPVPTVDMVHVLHVVLGRLVSLCLAREQGLGASLRRAPRLAERGPER